MREEPKETSGQEPLRPEPAAGTAAGAEERPPAGAAARGAPAAAGAPGEVEGAAGSRGDPSAACEAPECPSGAGRAQRGTRAQEAVLARAGDPSDGGAVDPCHGISGDDEVFWRRFSPSQVDFAR
ncbi:unnamed protein product [Prorocentrum cordatum]|uniref:Uncharacterized protein n=1 Tax=Prorocentrum cordatum TaxID=2364126 RepID=A0ABN9WVP0_9DINO|nr:unnamed protein product [Polarella glacialis]